MSTRETKIQEIDFDYFQDNSCDLSQPYQGQVLKVTYPGEPAKVVCYIVHPDDVEALAGLV